MNNPFIEIFLNNQSGPYKVTAMGTMNSDMHLEPAGPHQEYLLIYDGTHPVGILWNNEHCEYNQYNTEQLAQLMQK